MSSRFIAQMEAILALYARPYDPLRPVICFDERPCFLIGDVVTPQPMQQAQPRREHYAYEKLGSCATLAAIEPLTGWRLAHVRPQRRKVEFAYIMQEIAAAFPQAEVIEVVLDNLNTHDKSAFYELFPAAQAHDLAERFAFHYTPLSGSWLNMVELEFSALARLCLNRRIPTIEQLEVEVLAFMRHRQQRQIKIDWQFSIQAARHTFQRHYSRVNSLNQNR